MSDRRGDREGLMEQVVVTLAGVADLAASLAVRGLARAREPVEEVVQRSDLRELARDGHKDLKARGELALGRHLRRDDVPHLEILARKADAR